jgi:DNA modification methylase
MENDNKYLIVALVMGIIFAGLGIYLYLLDRKISRIEQKQDEMKNANKNLK